MSIINNFEHFSLDEKVDRISILFNTSDINIKRVLRKAFIHIELQTISDLFCRAYEDVLLHGLYIVFGTSPIIPKMATMSCMLERQIGPVAHLWWGAVRDAAERIRHDAVQHSRKEASTANFFAYFVSYLQC